LQPREALNHEQVTQNLHGAAFFVPVLLSAQQSASPTSKTAPPTEPENPVLMDRPQFIRQWPPLAGIASSLMSSSPMQRETRFRTDPAGLYASRRQASGAHRLFPRLRRSRQKARPSVQVILVLDMVNIGFNQVSYSRQQMMRFFQENGGHLTQPVSIYLLTEDGVSLQPASSTDGNVEARNLTRSKPVCVP